MHVFVFFLFFFYMPNGLTALVGAQSFLSQSRSSKSTLISRQIFANGRVNKLIFLSFRRMTKRENRAGRRVQVSRLYKNL